MFGFAPASAQGPNREPGLQEFSVRKITGRRIPYHHLTPRVPLENAGFLINRQFINRQNKKPRRQAGAFATNIELQRFLQLAD
ncbi:hypothetical protein B5F75_01855 [Candidatus Avelusimicrobium gallicola]|uniref:Uncharacterized protein n=1 Tax=Candidatus Avelusimicrobium gallicola TaxID=2562704 RepID=A0A1Y4DFU5_9BACT|nr:hypothetical protein B5F75_01855 [Elusimicrobium sp. An273]